MADCEILIASIEALAGGADLNWSVDIAIDEWDGVQLDPSGQRVAVLDLTDRGSRARFRRDSGG